jgi:hypothetical protein
MNNEKVTLHLEELKRIVHEFIYVFNSKTKDPDDFISITEIEKMWSNLRNSTNFIYSNLVIELMSNIDESAIIRKKKDNTGYST